ncbi:MAG: hypothetical protein HZB14_01815, partial [Actinobacteria bacterium]|nr:hypothetical protein [Actinomycetota bacterium]
HITGDPDFDLWADLGVTIDGKSDAVDLTDYSCAILHEADLDGDGEFEPISRMTTSCGGGGGGGGGGAGGSLRVLPTVNKITVDVSDAAGNTSSRVIDVYLDTDPPSIAIDEPGVHITGDPDFDLLFTIDDNSLDVDGPLSASCARKGWDGTIKGTTKISKADAGRALNGECSFTGVADGDYEVELMVIDAGGHVTVLKHSMTVDTTPPSIAIDESGVHITGDPDFDLWADLGVTIDGKSDAVDLTDYSCSILHEADLDGDGEFEPISRMTTSCGGGGGGGAGGSLRVLPTVNKITLEVGDAAGNTSSRVIDVYLDADPPSIAIDESGVHITGDPDFDLLFTTDDNSLDVDGPLSASCTRKGWDGTIKGSAKLTKADAGRALNGECSFTGVADGDYEVELMVTDAGGHVTVLKHSMTVDTTPPSIAIDEQGVHFTADSFFDIDFEVDEPHLGIPRCGVATGAGAAAGAARCIDETCASTGDLDGDGLPGFRCRVAGFDEDGERFEIVVTDVLGHHSNAWFDVVLDTTPPSITPVDPLDDDSDGDGFADRRFRPAFFDITYLVADASFADPVARSRGYGSGTCVVTTRSTGTVSTGKIETGAAGDVTCSFEGLPEGDYDVTFSISDAAGNRASRSVGVTVDTTPPAISILSPADGDWIACPAGDDPAATGVVPVKFTLSDSTADIAGVEISFNRGPRQTVSLDGSLQVQTAEMVVDCRELTTGVDVEYRVYATDRAGNQDDQPATVLIDKAPPVLLTIDPRDADSDGDGFADDRLRPPSFELFFDTYEEGSGIAENGISCGLEGPAGKAVKGKIKVIKDSTGGVACQVEDAADGDLFVVVKVADTSGHVTVLKRGFTVDATGPVVTFTGPADADSDGDGVADDPYRTAEFDVPLSFDDGSGSGVDPNRSSCKLVPGGGVVSAAVSGLVDSDGDGSIDSCHVTNAPEGPVALVIVGYDRFGNTGPQAPSKRTWIVDSSPPQLVTSSKGDTDSDGDGVADDPIRSSSFEVAFEASDALSGIDPESPTCSAEYITSIGLPKITPKIAKEHHGKFRCMVEGAQSGPVKVTGTVRDHAGNVVLNRVTFTVDATGPAINLTDPGDADADGDVYADKPDRESRFAIPFSVRNDPDGKAAQTARCVVRGWDPVKKTPILGVADLDGDGAPDACVVEFAPEGEIEIALMVGSGNQTDVIVRKFVIQPPQA